MVGNSPFFSGGAFQTTRSPFEQAFEDEKVLEAIAAAAQQQPQFGSPAPMAPQMPQYGALSAAPQGNMPALMQPPQQPAQPPQQSMGQQWAGGLLGSPGMAMASAAIANLGSGGRGPQQDPIQAYQQAQNTNDVLLMRKAEFQDRKLERDRMQQLRDLQMQKAQQDLNPFYEYETAKANGIIPKDMSYQQFNLIGGRQIDPGSIAKTMSLWTANNPPPPESDQAAYASWKKQYDDVFDSALRPRIKYDMGGGGVSVASGVTGDTVNTLVTPEVATSLDAGKASAVTTASEEAKVGVNVAADATERGRVNDIAYNVYQTGMKTLDDALSGTINFPGAELLPNLTADQRKAAGARAVMAPVLKQMFRESGEGTFTQADQDILLAMLPDQNDSEEARAFKMKAIDDIVRAKLNMKDTKSSSNRMVYVPGQGWVEK